MKKNKYKFAYGGQPIKLQDPSEATFQNMQNIINSQLDAEKKAGGWKIAGDIMSQVGGSLVGKYGGSQGQFLNNIADVSGGLSRGDLSLGEFALGATTSAMGYDFKRKPLEKQFKINSIDKGLNLKPYNNLDELNNLNTMDKVRHRTYASGGEIPPTGYPSPINFNNKGYSIRVKNYPQNGRNRYYVFTDGAGVDGNKDYIYPNEVMQRVLRDLQDSNPDLDADWISGDRDHRKLYDDDKFDFDTRFSSLGNWYTAVKDGDPNYFQKSGKYTTPRQGIDEIEQNELSGRKPFNKLDPVTIERYKRFQRDKERVNNYYNANPPTMAGGGTPPKNPFGEQITYDEHGNKYIRGYRPADREEMRLAYSNAFNDGKLLDDEQLDYFLSIGGEGGYDEGYIDTKTKIPAPTINRVHNHFNHKFNPNTKEYDVFPVNGFKPTLEHIDNVTKYYSNKYPEVKFRRKTHAFGGQADFVPIEAEGQELIETPDGQISEIQGPSHEQGGVPMEVPQDSVIYSKRLKGIDGQTMAKRKEFREKHLARLEKLVKLNPRDKMIKKTYEKTLKDFEKQEADDIEYMNYINEMDNASNLPTMAYGGGVPNKPYYGFGSPYSDDRNFFF